MQLREAIQQLLREVAQRIGEREVAIHGVVLGYFDFPHGYDEYRYYPDGRIERIYYPSGSWSAEYWEECDLEEVEALLQSGELQPSQRLAELLAS